MVETLFCLVVPIRGRDGHEQIPETVGHLFYFFGPRRRLAMPLTAKGAESSPLFLCLNIKLCSGIWEAKISLCQIKT